MTTNQYESALNVTQAKVVELEQQMALVNHLVVKKEQEAQRETARASLADFLHCVERNREG